MTSPLLLLLCTAILLTAILGGAETAAAEPPTIHPGAVWPDNRGQHIQAHGGGILKFGST